MPTITLNKKIVEQLIGKKLSVDELKDRISMLGTDLEKVENDEIVVEVFPNRPDMLSEQGFSRALSSFIGINTGLKEYKVNKPLKDYKVIIDNSVDKIRPLTSCAIVKELNFDDNKIKEIIQMQEKLHITFGRKRKKLAIGIYPLDKIKLPITYKAMKPELIKFRPLESKFDMNGLDILEMHPTGIEYAHLLKDKKLFPVFIDANDEILSMPPIINSDKTGRVTTNTKDVFVECSGFDQDSLNQCLNIIVTTLAEMGGKVYEMEILKDKNKTLSPNLKPSELEVDFEYINKIIGVEFKDKEIIDLLERMGLGYKNKKVLVPCYRTDILHPMDIAEDIAIAYGYENFEPIIPNVATIGKEDEFEIFIDRISDIFVGLGMIETMTYHLTNINDNNTKMNIEDDMIVLENSLNADYTALRSWLTPSLMKVLSENKSKELPQYIFETGRVFSKNKKFETNTEERTKLSVIMCNQDIDFTRIKQVLDAFMRAIDKQYSISHKEHNSFIEGRCGAIIVDGKEVGIIGEIHPQVLKNWEIIIPVSAFEIDLNSLV